VLGGGIYECLWLGDNDVTLSMVKRAYQKFQQEGVAQGVSRPQGRESNRNLKLNNRGQLVNEVNGRHTIVVEAEFDEGHAKVNSIRRNLRHPSSRSP
jgi:hypothetical protein